MVEKFILHPTEKEPRIEKELREKMEAFDGSMESYIIAGKWLQKNGYRVLSELYWLPHIYKK